MNEWMNNYQNQFFNSDVKVLNQSTKPTRGWQIFPVKAPLVNT